MFNNPLSFTDPSGYQTCSGYNTSDCGIDEIEVPGKRPSTDPCQYSMCGQDAFDYLRNFQNDPGLQTHQDFVAQATAWLLYRDAVVNGGSTVWNGYTISVSNSNNLVDTTGSGDDLTFDRERVAMGVAPNPRIIAVALAASAKLAYKKVSTLFPGPYAKQSIPGHRGRPTADEQRKINELMEENGCHTCGTKNPGTKSGNAIVDHQPAQALGETKIFLPHCIVCMRQQGGEVAQELFKKRRMLNE